MKGRLGKMTTEIYEVFSLEEGDTVVIAGNMYVVVEIGGDDSTYTLRLADEEGNPKRLDCKGNDRVKVVIEDV